MTEVSTTLVTTLGDNITSQELWVMPDPIWASGLVLTALELAVAVFANTLLIATICYSPNLKTPPNVQLVSYLNCAEFHLATKYVLKNYSSGADIYS